MKTIVMASIGLLCVVTAVSLRRSGANVSSTADPEEVFTGTSPCADFVKPFLRIPADVKCDRISWQLSIRPGSKTYQLTREYGFHVDNRTYQSHGSTSFEGSMATTKGRAYDPQAAVLQLDAGKSPSIAFAVVDQNVLHLLDTNQRLTIGNSGASYTINKLRASPSAGDGFTNETFTENGATAQTSFGGRSPCQEIAKELKRPVGADCFKLKWALELHRDPRTLVPTTYKLRGTLYRNESHATEQPREGKWKIIRGTKTDPNAIVYQLDAFRSDGPIYLMKADDGILFFLDNNGRVLVGDKDFSYTLNRFE
jgi:hypothetical protein